MDPEAKSNTTNDGEIGLASVLNILWRRRLIVLALPVLGLIAGVVYGQVVTPLYLGTATIRPGITSFGPNGGGHREWRLKDVERWYESGMYRPWTARRMDRAPMDVPLIRASFIQRGLQNTQRGDVITLTTLDASRENAAAGLEASIDAFVDFAMADTMSNSIVLTRRGLEIQMDEMRRRQTVLEARVDSVNADLAVARVESLQIDDDAARLAVVVQRMEDRRAALDDVIAALEERIGSLREQREELVAARRTVRTRLGDAPTEVPAGVEPEATLGDASVLRGLVSTSADLDRELADLRAEVDSLRRNDAAAEREIAFLRARNRTMIAFQRAEIGRRMESLRSARDFGVPNALMSLRLRLREKLGQLQALSPIERIGAVEVTEDPVRPRKKRAISILTLLGLIGGIAGAFVFDYVWNNRRRIFRG